MQEQCGDDMENIFVEKYPGYDKQVTKLALGIISKNLAITDEELKEKGFAAFQEFGKRLAYEIDIEAKRILK